MVSGLGTVPQWSRPEIFKTGAETEADINTDSDTLIVESDALCVGCRLSILQLLLNYVSNSVNTNLTVQRVDLPVAKNKAEKFGIFGLEFLVNTDLH